MNTVRPLLRVVPDGIDQLFPADLSHVPRRRLIALSSKLYAELDTEAPAPGARDRYYALAAEIESRTSPYIQRGTNAPSS